MNKTEMLIFLVSCSYFMISLNFVKWKSDNEGKVWPRSNSSIFHVDFRRFTTNVHWMEFFGEEIQEYNLVKIMTLEILE